MRQTVEYQNNHIWISEWSKPTEQLLSRWSDTTYSLTIVNHSLVILEMPMWAAELNFCVCEKVKITCLRFSHYFMKTIQFNGLELLQSSRRKHRIRKFLQFNPFPPCALLKYISGQIRLLNHKIYIKHEPIQTLNKKVTSL